MDRREQLLKHITKDQKGIELGPWFAPLASKRGGYNCLSFDLFDTDTLKKKAQSDPCVDNGRIASIETVDIVGNSTEIYDAIAARGELSSFDYIISSHNYEHLPNPIKFLQGCEKVLKPGGYLSMAVPDKRTCFDYFRPVSTLGSWLEAYAENRSRPTPVQSFEQQSLHSRYSVQGKEFHSFEIGRDPVNIIAHETLNEAYITYMQRKTTGDTNYYDTHCWTSTPSSFHMNVLDLAFLGLINFGVEEITENNGNEFYVHLRCGGYSNLPVSDFYAKRQELLRSTVDECAYNSVYAYGLRAVKARPTGEPGTDKFPSTEAEIAELSERAKRLEAENSYQRKLIMGIRSSLTWRLASPLWRLETRKARKEHRRKSPK
jgi:Methyltransferase domain